MLRFALITEGITDQVILEYILYAQYGKQIVVNPIQPARDATDEARQASGGGFERIVDYCRPQQIAQILETNDYLIFQIDTDIHAHPSIGLLHRENAGQMRDAFCKFLQTKISPQFAEQWFQSQILFAIAHQSLECWLLPLYAQTPADKAATKSCFERLQRLRKDQGLEKTHRTYQKLGRELLGKGKLQFCRQHQISLDLFLNSLPPAPG